MRGLIRVVLYGQKAVRGGSVLETVPAAKVVMYGTRACPYCDAARRLLAKKGLPYEDIRVDEHPERRVEMRTRGGGHTVPQIWINARHIGGCDDLYALEAKGELNRLLAENQA